MPAPGLAVVLMKGMRQNMAGQMKTAVSKAAGDAVAKGMTGVGVQQGIEDWKAKKRAKEIAAIMKRRVRRATNYLQQTTRRNVGTPLDKIRVKSKRTKRMKSRIVRRSAPGEFPRRETGTMHRSIYKKIITQGLDTEGHVGTNLAYAIHHELTERPWLTRTAKEERATIDKMLRKG